METAAPALKPKATTHKRDAARARVFPGAGARDDAVGRHTTTFVSTFQIRDSDAECATQRAPRPLRHLEWWQPLQRKYAFCGRYSVGKLQALSDYQRGHALPRTLFVLAWTPMPSIAILVALLSLPLASPMLGASHNSAAFLRSFVSHIGASFGITLVMKQALGFSDRVYPYWRCLLLASLASGTNETLWTLLAFAWRFPIPFREVLCASTWVVWFALYHFVTMRRHFALKQRRLRMYLPVFTLQFGIFYAFLMLTAVFAFVGVAGQVVLVLVVPPIKVAVKLLCWRLTKQLDDLSTDVTVCVVEISAAIYQCLVMQYAATPLLPGLFFLTDLLQAVVESALFVDHNFLVRRETAMTVAVDIIAHARAVEATRRTHLKDCNAGGLPPPHAQPVVPPNNHSLIGTLLQTTTDVAATSTDPNLFLDFRPTAQLPVPSPRPRPSTDAIPPTVDGLVIPRAADARLLPQLLRVLFATEMLVFVEFIEVVLALLYVVLFGLASVLPGGLYIVSLMELSDQGFADAMRNAGVHFTLELVSFVLVLCLLRRQGGLSMLLQVAYVLETYWMTIQGKLVSCLLLLLNLATQHQGTDLSFRFVNYNRG